MHVYCKNCMKAYCEGLIMEGSIGKLICPNEKCETFIREKDLKDLDISAEMLKKYDEFSVSKAIDQMDDYTWCPSCNGHAEVEKSKNMGFCQNCHFKFCT